MSAGTNPLFAPGVIQAPFATRATGERELVNMEELGFFQALMGSENNNGGYHTEGDLVSVSADGRDLNEMWAEFLGTLALVNERQSALVQLMTFPVQQLVESVPQVGEVEFEDASEFGVPGSARLTLDYYEMAYDFRDYDLATRYTWKFLRDADARQIEAVHQQILAADQRLIFRRVMEAIFDNANRTADIRKQAYNVYPLYNADGTVPATYKGKTFDGTHSHYMVSGSATIDSGDLEDAYEKIAEHGFGLAQGTTFITMLNRTQIKEVRKFRAGVVNNNAAVAQYDFIPSATQPALIVPNSDGLIGSLPPSIWNGLPVVGSYAGMLIIEESYIPEGYMLMFGTGGSGDLQNLVGLREHANPAYRGLRLLPGNQQNYPLVDSFYSRGFGTGIRQRAGGVVMQFKTTGAYTAPVAYTKGGGNA